MILYGNTYQYASVAIAMAKVIAAEMIVCYPEMLSKWKAVFSFFAVGDEPQTFIRSVTRSQSSLQYIPQ